MDGINQKINDIKFTDHYTNNRYLNFFFDGKRISLRPVQETENEIYKLACWREKYHDAFPMKFYVIPKDTKKWVNEQLIHNPHRLLFIIWWEDKILGHIGYFKFNKSENYCEIDNVMKGVDGFKGLMLSVMKNIILFAFEEFNLDTLYLNVFSNNQRAITLYEKSGFKLISETPLKKVDIDEFNSHWEETTKVFAQRYYYRMELKNDFK